MTIKLPEPRKAYTCKTCSHTYLDDCVTSCDCMPAKDEFYEDNLYTESQLKQAIRDALEEAAKEFDEHPGWEMFAPPAAETIRELKEQIK